MSFFSFGPEKGCQFSLSPSLNRVRVHEPSRHTPIQNSREYRPRVGDTQKWLASFLSHRKQRILIKNCVSDAFIFGTRAPQGKLSATGSILNIRCWVIQDHWQTSSQRTHGYADDTESCLSFWAHSAASQDAVLRRTSAIQVSYRELCCWCPCLDALWPSSDKWHQELVL